MIEAVPNDQPTTWCTNPVIAPKPHNPEAIRFCSDMRVPNTAILRPVTEALTVEDIKFKLEGYTVLSVLDMNEGYHQLELDESSRHMITFYGTECKMRYTRLNYGPISAQVLTHQGVKWSWSSTEQAAFDILKHTLSSDTVLGYYEAGLETKLLVDAGPNGLGLILLQRKPEGWKAVECASRSLTEVEKRYPQIDREALAIRWPANAATCT